MGIQATDPLTNLLEKTRLLNFARNILWRHQYSQLQPYIGSRPALTLRSHKIPTLGIRMSLRGYDTDRISSA